LDREEKTAETDEPEEIQLTNLYLFVYTQPDALLGMLMSLFDVLVEKDLLSDEEINGIVAKGIERWKMRK